MVGHCCESAQRVFLLDLLKMLFMVLAAFLAVLKKGLELFGMISPSSSFISFSFIISIIDPFSRAFRIFSLRISSAVIDFTIDGVSRIHTNHHGMVHK
jgi:hypothetical protein